MTSNDLAPAGTERRATPVSTLVLMGVSAVALLTVVLAPAGLPGLVLAVVAFSRRNGDPAGTRRLTRIGWVVLSAGTALIVLLVVVFVVLLAVNGFS